MRSPLALSLSTLDSPQDSPLGPLSVVTDADGCLRALDFADFMPRCRTLLSRHYGAEGVGWTLQAGRCPAAIADAFTAYFAGDLHALNALPVATGGTAFQREVWAALRRIPVGTTTSYGALAAAIGRPAAVRAVGLANGANPIGIVVPCHRVVGSTGKLTGYAGGVMRKAWLIAHEWPAQAAPANGLPAAPGTGAQHPRATGPGG